MKKLLIALLLAVSVSAFAAAKEYKNTNGRDGARTSYTFQMNQKCAPLAGVFTPVTYNRYIMYRPVGNSLSARGGGGGRVIKEPHERTIKGKHDVIIVGRRLANMADGDEIELKDGQTLFRIGVFTLPDGRTLPVFSYNKRDTVKQYCSPKEK